MCKTRLDTKIHPRLVRGCKVREDLGSHHRPSRSCRNRGNPGTQVRYNRKDARFGETRRSVAGVARGAGIRGNLETHPGRRRKMKQPGQPGDSSPGRQRMQNSGQPGGASLATLEGAKFGATRRSTGWRAKGAKLRGDPEIHRRQCRRVRDSRKLEKPPVGMVGRCGVRGNSQLHRKAVLGSEAAGQPGGSTRGR